MSITFAQSSIRPPLSEAVREAMTEGASANSRWAVLEHHLRIVIKLIRDAQTLNPTELQHVETLLGPLWEYRTANCPSKAGPGISIICEFDAKGVRRRNDQILYCDSGNFPYG